MCVCVHVCLSLPVICPFVHHLLSSDSAFLGWPPSLSCLSRSFLTCRIKLHVHFSSYSLSPDQRLGLPCTVPHGSSTLTVGILSYGITVHISSYRPHPRGCGSSSTGQGLSLCCCSHPSMRPSRTGVQYFPECMMVMSSCLLGVLLPVSCTLISYLFLTTLF